MKNKDCLLLVGRAFADKEYDPLHKQLAEDCAYVSEVSGAVLASADEIIKRMKWVNETASPCSVRVANLVDITKDGAMDRLQEGRRGKLHPSALLLFSDSKDYPESIITITQDDETEKIQSIHLSRSRTLFDVLFYNGTDSPYDTPATVMPVEIRGQYERPLGDLTGILPRDLDEKDKPYIWIEADRFLKGWLKDNGYYVRETRTFEYCVGYKCNKNHSFFTVYMYAFGNYRPISLDGERCSSLLDYDFSKDSTVLITYLRVRKNQDDKTASYTVGRYDSVDEAPQLWTIREVNGQHILQYYPRAEVLTAVDKFISAFNHDSPDAFDCFVDKRVTFDKYKKPVIGKSSVYADLLKLHRQFGDMRIGYQLANDVLYCIVPFLEKYGWFSITISNDDDKITRIKPHAFLNDDDGSDRFIRTDNCGEDSWYNSIPVLTEVSVFPPVDTERFALKLKYDNGDCRKFILPIEKGDEKEEVLKYGNYVMTDRIWQSARLIQERKAEADYPYFEEILPKRGPAVEFKNGLCLPGSVCYEEGTPYSEPSICKDTIYRDKNIEVTREWRWAADSLYEDKETHLIHALLSGEAFNYNGISTYVSIEGKRLTTVDYDYSDTFHDSIAVVGKKGFGGGYVDKDLNLVIPMVYEQAYPFQNGLAKVRLDGQWSYLDKQGKVVFSIPDERGYEVTGDFHDGLCKVSTMLLELGDLAFHSDYMEIAGKWGFINLEGKEIIAPQFIYANDFSNGIAIVCKGEWTIDPKWDNRYNTGKYWTEKELWGAIDTDGETVIPFIFDEIKFFSDTDDVFMAHFGGWEKGHWGVIDNRGKWLAEPMFEDIDYEYHDGLFAFYQEYRCGDDVPMGIYDLNQKKVLFDPQFYDVSFLQDGWIEVEVYDEGLGRTVEKIIDRDGNEKFHSVYSHIYTWKRPYEVVIEDKDGWLHGLVDEEGKVILPCEHKTVFNGISAQDRILLYKQEDNVGVKSFQGAIIIPPIYHEIHGLYDPLLTVRKGDKSGYKEGLMTKEGREVIPAVYDNIHWCEDKLHILCSRAGNCEVYSLITFSKES